MNIRRAYIICSFIFFTVLGVTIPGLVLHIIFSSRLNTTFIADQSLYKSSDTAIAKLASENLSEDERLQLILSTTDCTVEIIPELEAPISEAAAMYIAKNQIEKLNSEENSSYYPFDISHKLNEEYYWEASYYKCTNSNFSSYSACFWKIDFISSDSDEIHSVYVSDNGTLIAIYNNRANMITLETIEVDEEERANIYPAIFTAIYPDTFLESVIEKTDNYPFAENNTLSSNPLYFVYTVVQDDEFLMYLLPKNINE